LNRYGDFRNEYYFLYDNGELTNEVSIEEFIKFEVGNTLVIKETYRIK